MPSSMSRWSSTISSDIGCGFLYMDVNIYGGACAGCRLYVQPALEIINSRPDALQADAIGGGERVRIKSFAVVLHYNSQLFASLQALHNYVPGAAVLQGIAEQLLHKAVDHDLLRL